MKRAGRAGSRGLARGCASALAVAWIAAAAAAQPAELRAGAARRELELPQGVPLAGYGARMPWNHSAGRRDPVGVRALVLESDAGPRVALVVLDVLIASAALREAVAEQLAPLSLDALVLAATHTHSGPGGYVDAWPAEVAVLGWYDEAVFSALTAAAADAVRAAWADRAPAQLGVALAAAPGLAHNRRRSGGTTDPTVPVLRVDTTSGAPIATLFALAAHPTALSARNDRLSADYPGPARALVEARRGGVAVFLAGPLGDQEPAVAPGDDPEQQAREAAALGERLAQAVMEAAEIAAPRADARLALRVRTLRLPPVAVRARCGGYVLAPLLHLAAADTLPHRAPLAALRLGPLDLLASPFELGVEVAEQIRSRHAGPLLVAAHANDWLGYLLQPEDFDRGGYETCLSFFGRDAAKGFVDAAASVLNELDRAAPPPAGMQASLGPPPLPAPR